MLDFVNTIKNEENSVKEFNNCIRQGIPSAVFGVNKSFKNYLVSTVDSPVLFVVKDAITGEASAKEIAEFSGKKTVFIPPKDFNLVLIKAFSKDSLFSRLVAIDEMPKAEVIIVTPETLMQTFPEKLKSVNLERGKEVDLQLLTQTLVKLGYERVDSCVEKGTFSARGDLLDVFPVNSETPFRIDFFGDEIESIKAYDRETRETIKSLSSVSILQASEFLLSGENVKEIDKLLDKEIYSSKKEVATRLKVIKEDIIRAFENGDLDVLSSFPYLLKGAKDIFSVLKEDTVVIYDEAKGINELFDVLETEFLERFNSLFSSGEVFSIAKEGFFNKEKVLSCLKKHCECAVQTLSTAVPFFNPLKIINPQNSGIANYHLDFKEVYSDIENWLYSGYRILVFCGNAKRAEVFSSELSARGIASTLQKPQKFNGVCISSDTLSYGFVFHESKTVIIGNKNLYSRTNEKKKLKTKKQSFFSAPETGDYCVHETHGIGKVLGSKRISSTESTKDYVAVLYAGGDVLYVPVEQMDVLTRYLGSEKSPRLSKIGGTDFERVKKAVKESIKKMSFDLKKLYSERNAEDGFEFFSDKELENAFSDAFPFEETPDQEEADKEILSDMQSAKVMDRLICGDVGFGKTEVALRAVFRAVVNGKQAVLLAPTTILTEQHYNTAVKRFEGFGVKIACLNRFRTPVQQKKIVEGLKNGEIDLVIGTHRLLSKDIGFKDLGLLVLDEEQRFGVEHKEKIKLLKKNVDTLTLTATPIPRTLHMSLSGIRSISTLNTPPKKRLPVQTYVTEETETLIKDAVLREINRGGQAFILYNRVESIFTFAEKVRSLIPNVKMTVVHGQMDERTMEKNIVSFYQGETNLLISTTIIENGIDLPRANTLIVIDADKMGLSTLYQLKGRVGRSDKLAYAYFTFKRDKILSQTAYERLNAIIEFAEMGSGIKIAMRDLEIRGAGNILGAEQHGHMDKIGYELYSKLLKEELSGEEERVPDLDIRINAYIPERYIERPSARMDAYKRIAEIKDRGEEEEFIKEITEIFGTVPEEVINLINIALLKYLCMKINAEKIVINKERASIIFDDLSLFKNAKIVSSVEKSQGEVVINVSDKVSVDFNKEGKTNKEMLIKMRTFLENN